MTFSTGLTSVTGNVTAVPASFTTLAISGTGNGGVQSAYTTPAGKKVKVYGIAVPWGASGYAHLYKNDGTSVVYYSNEKTGTNISSVPLWEYAAGEVVKINATNSLTYVIIATEEAA